MKRTLLKSVAMLLSVLMLSPILAACGAEPSEGTETTAVVTDAPATEAEKPSSENSAEPTDEPATNSPEDVPSGTETEEDTDGGDVPSGAVTEGATEGDSAPIYTEETDTDADSPDATENPDATEDPDATDTIYTDSSATTAGGGCTHNHGSPNVDLDNYLYKAYVRSKNSGNGAFYCEDFWVESSSYDPLSYAVYSRNLDIEDGYNCRIRQVDSTTATMYDEMKTFYLGGETYELAILLAKDAAACALSGLLLDIHNLDNIRLENATYDQSSVDQFTMADKLYYFSGDMNISPLDNTAVTIYNTDLFKTYDFARVLGNEDYKDLYKMVANGKWTVDAMLEMAQAVEADADNSGGVLDATTGDTVGYFQDRASALYYWYGCGARISELDIEDGGYPEIVYGDNIASEVFDFLYHRLNTAVKHPEMPVGDSATKQSYYATKLTLFTDVLLNDVRKTYYENKYSYGILPIPKFDEAQDRYYAPVSYENLHLWSVPRSCENADYASFLFNVIAVHSARPANTMDAYYTKILELSVAQDAGSRVDLKIVRDSLTYDIALLYDWGGFITGTLGRISSETSNRYSEATDQAALDVAVEEMNKTLQGFKQPTLPESDS